MGVIYTTDEMTIEEFEQTILRERVDPPHHSQRFWADQRWIVENMASLLAQYPGQWIAVYKGEVISASRDLAMAEKKSVKIVGDDEVATFFVAAENYVYEQSRGL